LLTENVNLAIVMSRCGFRDPGRRHGNIDVPVPLRRAAGMIHGTATAVQQPEPAVTFTAWSGCRRERLSCR
jgi:hypothetical protein